MLVKIDRNTIRLNPDRNKTHIFLEGRVDMSFEFSKSPLDLPEFLWNHPDFIINEYSSDHCKGVIESPDLFDKIMDSIPDGMTIRKNNNRQRIAVGPQPKYLFKYEDIDIHCEECKKSYKLIELEEMYWPHDSNAFHCPKEHNIELEFEEIEDIKL